MKVNHYKWCSKYLLQFFKSVGISHFDQQACEAILVAHGDKCSTKRDYFEAFNIPFPHAVAIYILTYIHPFKKEVRETPEGWVDPFVWIKDEYRGRFKKHLPEVDATDPSVLDRLL